MIVVVGLVHFENDGAPRPGRAHGKSGGTDLQHVPCFEARADLTASVDSESLTAHRRNPQPAKCAGSQHRVALINSRCSQLQVLIGSAADRQPACMEKNAAGRGGGPGRASAGSLA